MSRVLPERVTTIDDTLELEWYAGDTIVAYVLSDMSPEALQNWSDAALDVINSWSSGKPYLALYDLSHSGVVFRYSQLVKGRMCSLGITKAGEEKTRTNIAQRGGLSARMALHTSLRHSGHLGRLFAKIDALRELNDPVVEYDVFYDRDAALDWLKEIQT